MSFSLSLLSQFDDCYRLMVMSSEVLNLVAFFVFVCPNLINPFDCLVLKSQWQVPLNCQFCKTCFELCLLQEQNVHICMSVFGCLQNQISEKVNLVTTLSNAKHVQTSCVYMSQ